MLEMIAGALIGVGLLGACSGEAKNDDGYSTWRDGLKLVVWGGFYTLGWALFAHR